MNRITCSIVIPSYQRGRVLLDSLKALLLLQEGADEIIVVDQTVCHDGEIEAELSDLAEKGRIRWVRLKTPSIPHAMNVGLVAANSDIVLFLDDDIIPDKDLISVHRDSFRGGKLTAGMVLQPGEVPLPLASGESFRFNSTEAAKISEFMGCNFSVGRGVALALGGFDENFIGAAYRYEAEFAWRFVRAYGPIRFEPRAVINHLQLASGGTRSHGHHLRTVKPTHAAGAYYFLLRTRQKNWFGQLVWRPLRSVRTRHHLRRPWWIPVTLVSELRGFILALKLLKRGAILIGRDGSLAGE